MELAEWRQPVIKVPLTQAFPQLDEVKEFRSKICLFNHDRTKVFDVVSPKYQVIEHGKAFDTIQQALNKYFDTEVKSGVRSINGASRIRAEFKLPIKPIIVARGDVSEITIVMRNSYDRAWVFSALLGAFRLVCSNGAMIHQSFGGVRGKHVSINGEDDSEFMKQLDLMICRAPMLKDLWKDWSDTEVSYDEAYEMLDSRFPRKYLEPILQAERFPKTKWDLYNDLTRFATHDTKSVARRVEFDEKISNIFYGDYEEIEEEEEEV